MYLLSKKDVRARIKLSFAQIARLEHDPEYEHIRFPRRVRIGGRVFWVDSEVDEWMQKRIAERDTHSS